MAHAYFWGFLLAAFILWGTIWITNKAYSKKWDDSDK